MHSEHEIEITLDRPEQQSSETKDEFAIDVKDFYKKYHSSFGKNALRRSKYNIEKYLSGTDGTGTKQLTPIISSYDVLQAVIPPHDIGYLAQLYDKSSWNYAAINAKVANVIGLGYRFDLSDSMKSKVQQITDQTKLEFTRNKIERMRQQMEIWLDSLNDSDTFLQTMTKMYIDYQATGNGYLEVGRISTGPNKGQIGYLGHIPTSTLRVRRFHDGYVQMVEGRVRFFRNYGDTTTKDPLEIDPNPNEIIHFKNYSPTNTFYGSPDTLAALNAIAGDEFAQRFNLDLFEHRAAPRYVIVAKGANLSQTAQAQILEFLQSGLKGKNHRSLYIPLPPDRDGSKTEIKFEPVENKIQDSSFDNYRRSNRDEILAVHRVPSTKVGLSDNTTSSASINDDKTFKEVVCRPEQDFIEKKVNRIIAEKTDIFILQFNELTLTDALAQSQIDERYLRLKTITPNEARARSLQLGPIEGGDDMVDLKPQQAADQKATALQSRTRDAQRDLTATDSNNQPRSPKGEGSTPVK